MRGAWWIAIGLSLSVLAGGSARAADERTECIAAADRGQVARDDGRLRSARHEFIDCSRDACPSVIQRDCAAWLADVAQRLPDILVRARDESGSDVFDVTVSLDGEVLAERLDGRLLPVDPGAHTLRFARRSSVIELPLVLREGERARTVDIAFKAPLRAISDAPSEQHRAPIRVVPIVFAGVAIASVVSFAWLRESARMERDDLRETCAPGCSTRAVDTVDRKVIIGDVALGVGVLALAAALWTFWRSPRSF